MTTTNPSALRPSPRSVAWRVSGFVMLLSLVAGAALAHECPEEPPVAETVEVAAAPMHPPADRVVVMVHR